MKISFFFLSLLCSTFAFAEAPHLVVLGDSLTEGYGVSKESAYPAILQNKIHDAGKDWIVINAGVSGSTSASAVSRMQWTLQSHPKIVILALGANDGLRGLKSEDTFKNLLAAGKMAQAQKAIVVIAGMQAPPNYGKDYTKAFAKIFPDLAKQLHCKRIDFLLEGVAGHPDLNQADGIHPNEKGHKIVADVVYNGIKDLL